MADATGRIPSGFLTGSKIDFGTFHQCLNAKNEGNQETISFQGQFCMIGYKSPLIAPMHVKTPSGKSYVEAYGYPPEWISNMMKEQAGFLRTFGLWLGACLPSTCSEEDIRHIFSPALKPWAQLVSLTDCQVNSPKEWPPSAKIAICVFIIIFAVCLLATVVDIYDRKVSKENEIILDEDFNRKQLKAFSLYTSSEKLFESNARKSPLDCLHGIRVFLSIWVVFGHIFIFPEYWREVKYNSYGELLKFAKYHVIFLENPLLCMEHFCLMSGFLLTYSTVKKLERNGGKVNLIKFFLQKYFRLMPSFFFIFLLLYILPVTSSGPIWNSTWEFEHGKCENNWWKNIFLINNFSEFDDICILHTWFISLTMQLQIAGILLMMLTYRSPRFGVLLGIITIAVCILIDYNKGLFYQFENLSIYVAKDFRSARSYTQNIYIHTTNHFPSFVVGMVLGWILIKHKDKKLPKVYRLIGWIASLTLSTCILFFIKFPIIDYEIMAYYIAFRNIIYAFAFGWIVYSCVSGYGGILESFLSLKTFVPLSHLSYLVYLIHPILIMHKGASMEGRMNMTLGEHTFEFVGVFVISVMIAYIGYISVELPFNTIYDNLLESRSSKILTTYVTKENGAPKMNKNGVSKLKEN